MKRPLTLWILAIIITLVSVVFQRLTGPTHPVRGSVQVDQEVVKFKLPRSHDAASDAEVKIHVRSLQTRGEIRWRRFKSHDTLSTAEMERQGEHLIAAIPKQPPAGKVVYQVALIDGNGLKHDLTDQPVIIRYKGSISALILIPHVILMFTAMLLAARTGLEALVRGAKTYRLAVSTAIVLFVGGMIFGPIVQKCAFGAFWTGWPFGHDLTDTKAAIAMLFWLIALWRGRNQERGRGWVMVAAVVTLVIYLIPHSAHGSELDYRSMNQQVSGTHIVQ